ncbi:unnamed protein product [Closterium sp. Yama58-4]|nr:unnamed protein product [Closterium sp. Yama58-4]
MVLPAPFPLPASPFLPFSLTPFPVPPLRLPTHWAAVVLPCAALNCPISTAPVPVSHFPPLPPFHLPPPPISFPPSASPPWAAGVHTQLPGASAITFLTYKVKLPAIDPYIDPAFKVAKQLGKWWKKIFPPMLSHLKKRSDFDTIARKTIASRTLTALFIASYAKPAQGNDRSTVTFVDPGTEDKAAALEEFKDSHYDAAKLDPTGVVDFTLQFGHMPCGKVKCVKCYAIRAKACTIAPTCVNGKCGNAGVEADGTSCTGFGNGGNSYSGTCSSGVCSGSCSFNNGGCGSFICQANEGKNRSSCINPHDHGFAPAPMATNFPFGETLEYQYPVKALDCLMLCKVNTQCALAVTTWGNECWLKSSIGEPVAAETYQTFKKL